MTSLVYYDKLLSAPAYKQGRREILYSVSVFMSLFCFFISHENFIPCFHFAETLPNYFSQTVFRKIIKV